MTPAGIRSGPERSRGGWPERRSRDRLREAVLPIGGEKRGGKRVGLVFQDRLPQPAGQRDQRRQVVDGDQGGAEHLSGDDQVAQVGAAEGPAGGAGAGRGGGARGGRTRGAAR